jgi:hypothetical protein
LFFADVQMLAHRIDGPKQIEFRLHLAVTSHNLWILQARLPTLFKATHSVPPVQD